MKKLFLAFVVSFLSIVSIYAVPAYPGLITTTQPDGTTISYYLRGDEHFSFKMSEDGYLLALNEDGVFEYADFRDSAIIPLGFKASDVAKRSVAELDFLKKAVKVSDIQMQMEETISAIKQQKQAREVQRAAKYPTQGSPKSLVILVNFKDVKFLKETANADFTNMLNQDGYTENKATSSAREYFRTSSFGQFDPNFVVVGPYDLPKDVAYYGANRKDKAENDIHPDSMIIEACMLADEAGLDFTEFDTDSNGVLDNVFVYYAGHNEAEGAGEDRIWPHKSSAYSKTTFDGIRLSTYACTSELCGKDGTEQCGIGTFCHEFGHVISLPDFYVTDYSHELPTLYKWDVMDRGSYSNDGRTPPTYSAYERFFCGWLVPEPLDSLGLYNLEPLITSNKAYILSKTKHNLNGYSPDPVEFFLLENRQKIGIDSLGVPGEDMLITHVIYDQKLWAYNKPNNDPDNMCVHIECAAGTTYEPKRNPFPGADKVFDFKFVFKDEQVWDVALSAIQKTRRNISFLYGKTEDSPSITFENSISDFYALSNQQQYKDLTVSVRNIEGDVKFSFANSVYYLVSQRLADGSYTEPEATLTLNVPSKDEHLLDVAVVFNPRRISSNDDFFESRVLVGSDNFITAMPIKGKSRRAPEASVPTAFEARNITEESFVANWSYDEKASGYYFSLYTKSSKPSEELEDFSGFTDANNPKGWFYNFLSVDRFNYASSPLAVDFSCNEDTLWTKDYILPVASFDFWVKSMNKTSGKVIVDGFVDSAWTNVLTQPFDAETIDQIITGEVNNECYKFRIYVEFDNGKGSLLFDDFNAKFDYTAEYIIQDEELLQEEDIENIRVVRNYNPKQNYYYRVRATDKKNSDIEGRFENITDYSNEICVGDNNKKEKVEPLDITFADGSFVVNLKQLKENYVIYIYSADGRLVEEIVPTTKHVVLPALDANMYVVKYSEKGKVRRQDQVGKIFY